MKYLICFFCLIISVSASAAWKGYIEPKELLFEGDNSGARVYIVFKQMLPIDECRQDGNYIRIYGDTKKGEYFISTLLAAIAAKKEVKPAIAGCDDWGRPVLTGLRIR